MGFKVASASNYDQINVGSSLTLDTNSINVNLYSPNGASPFYGTGTFTLVNNAGSLYGNPASAISVANPLSDLTYQFGTAGSSVTLTIGAAFTHPVWTGGSSGNWSNPANWANGTPGSSDELYFDGSSHLATTNDQTGRTYAGMLFYTTAGAFTQSGNAVTLTGPITNYSPNTQTLNLPILFSSGGTINAAGGPIVTTALGTLDNGGGMLLVGGISSSTFNGAITDAGGLTVTGPGNVTLASPLNSYAGNTRIQSGTLTVGNPLALQNTVVDMNGADAGALSFGSQTAATLGGLIGARNINLGNTKISIGAWRGRHLATVHRCPQRRGRHHEDRQRQHHFRWGQHLYWRHLRHRRHPYPGRTRRQRQDHACGRLHHRWRGWHQRRLSRFLVFRPDVGGLHFVPIRGKHQRQPRKFTREPGQPAVS